jgi:transcriptional regulator with XRE-family HTH domain
MGEEITAIGARIRELREICGHTRESVARILNVGEEKYASYEDSSEDIPISALYQLANLFSVDINELLTGRAPHLQTYCLVKKGRGRKIDRYPGYSFQSLADTFKRKLMEPLLVTVEPSDEPKLVTHPGQEFNLCLEGTVDVYFDEKVLRLEKGDSVYFDPMHPHGQRAVGGRAVFLTVIAE